MDDTKADADLLNRGPAAIEAISVSFFLDGLPEPKEFLWKIAPQFDSVTREDGEPILHCDYYHVVNGEGEDRLVTVDLSDSGRATEVLGTFNFVGERPTFDAASLEITNPDTVHQYGTGLLNMLGIPHEYRTTEFELGTGGIEYSTLHDALIEHAGGTAETVAEDTEVVIVDKGGLRYGVSEQLIVQLMDSWGSGDVDIVIKQINETLAAANV